MLFELHSYRYCHHIEWRVVTQSMQRCIATEMYVVIRKPLLIYRARHWQ